jgi:cytochrome oxidase assembly protein ShyY1
VKPALRRALLWALALGFVALFVRAGFWQAGRATEKEAQLAATSAVLEARTPQPLARARLAMPAWVEVSGEFEDRPALRLDNQRRGSRVGVQVYRAFRTDAGERLWVDIGWRELPADRRVPDEPTLAAGGPQRLAGLLVPPPSAGLALGPAVSPLPDGGGLALRLEPAVLRDGLGTAAGSAGLLDAAVLRLDPALPIGHERDLDLLANTLSPDKHRGYALQWFGFAAGLLLLSLFLQFRRP